MQHERYGLLCIRQCELACVKAWRMAAGVVGDREALFWLSERSSVENSIAVFIMEGKHRIVGAKFTSDVASYEVMKIRLLNGSHLAMPYLGALHGFTYVHEVMSDTLFIRFIEGSMEEITPVVPVIPGVSLQDYKSSLLERFANPAISDQVTRICSEGSAKIPKWLLPAIQKLLERQRPIRLLVLVIASWIRYLALGVDENNIPLIIPDARFWRTPAKRLGVPW